MAETMKRSWCDVVWNPWLGRSGVRRKTSEANWKEPLAWNRSAEICNSCRREPIRPRLRDFPGVTVLARKTRPRVFVGWLMDLFENWQGPIVNAKGERLVRCTTGLMAGYRTTKSLGIQRLTKHWGQWATMADVRRDAFGVIDQCQNLDWLLLTKRPENVRRMWPIVPMSGRSR